MDSYVRAGFAELQEFTNWKDVYQLIRQYVYATRMADALARQPVVVPVINGEHLELLKPFYSIVQDSGLNCGRVFRDLVTWQALSASAASSGLACSPRLVAKTTEAIAASRKRAGSQEEP